MIPASGVRAPASAFTAVREKPPLMGKAPEKALAILAAPEWLGPYTDHTLQAMPGQGIKHIAVLSPAFSADCLETLEELELENRAYFMDAGGETYHYIPALNDRPDHIEAIVITNSLMSSG